MIHWFIINLMILFTSLFVILEKSFGMSIGLLVPLAWIIIPIASIMLIKWMMMFQWVIFNILVLLTCGLILIEKSFDFAIDILGPIAWIVFIVTLILVVKDGIMLRIIH